MFQQRSRLVGLAIDIVEGDRIGVDSGRLRVPRDLLDDARQPSRGGLLASDGGWLEILSLENKKLKIRYQGACGSCPSSLTGTLMAIENMIQDEIDPEIGVEAV